MSQAAIAIPVTGVYSGLQAAGYINGALATVNTCWLGSSAPSDAPNGIPAEGQFWIDTSSAGYDIVKRYDGTNWLIDSVMDKTNHVMMNPIGGGIASVASASTADLGSKNENYINITGTTSITAFGSAVPRGQAKVVVFGGALTLTYNATSMILPGGTNITTANGDAAIMVSLGSGNWKCIFYGRISGAQLSMTGTTQTLASATTTDLASAGSNAITVSGTTTITSFGSSATLANPYYLVTFSGSLILTQNATSLILPGGANITTQAGDLAIAQFLGSGNWRVSNYTRASGTALIATSAVVFSAIAGFIPSGVTGSSTTAALSVSAGQASDSANAAYIAKGTATAWAVSNGNAINGYDGGNTLPNSSTIHFFVCSGGSGTGVFASASLTPTFPTGYTTSARRIFSLQTTASGALIPVQNVTEIYGGAIINWLTTQVLDLNTSVLGTSRNSYTLSVPTGVRMQPLSRFMTDSQAATIVLTALDETDIAPTRSTTTLPGFDIGSLTGAWVDDSSQMFITTNTSGQIGARATSTNQDFSIVTRGWIDFRRT